MLQPSGQATVAPIRFSDDASTFETIAADRWVPRVAAISNRAAPHFYIQTQLLGRESARAAKNVTLRVESRSSESRSRFLTAEISGG